MQNVNCGQQSCSDNNGYFIVGERANKKLPVLGLTDANQISLMTKLIHFDA